jgi:aminotransferase
MALSVSKRSACVMQSAIRSMSIECARVGGINLSQGVCDTEVPLAVRRAAQRAIDDGVNIYTRYDGLKELRAALAHKMQKQGIPADPDSQITVTAGATGAFYVTCLALLNPGDEVILFEPYYGYHVSTLRALGMKPAFVPLRLPRWTFTVRDLERARTSRTRGIMVNTPANPSGKVFTRAEIEQIAAFARAHDLFVFTDEIYEQFLYDGCTHVSPASFPGMRERTITISGLSKTFSITGWRIGYTLSAARWAQTIGYFNDLVYVCAPAPLQMGVARGLTALRPAYYRRMRKEYTLKRDKLCAALHKAGLEPHVPQGAYYILADISRVPGRTSAERALRILRDYGVACVPGEAFYAASADGAGLARFCFAKQSADLDEACRRLERPLSR